jgi:hypothetical protein
MEDHVTHKDRLEASKLRLKKAFEELEKGIKNLKKKVSDSNNSNEIKQMEATFLATLNRINNKIFEIKKFELVEND